MIADCIWVVGNMERLKRALPGKFVDTGAGMVSWKLETKYYQAAIVFQKVEEDHPLEKVDDLMRPATEDQISPMKDNLSKARLQAQWGYQRVLPMIRQTLFQLVIF